MAYPDIRRELLGRLSRPDIQIGAYDTTPRRGLPLVLLWLAALPLLWVGLVAAPSLRVDVGVWGDHTFLDGVNGIEYSSTEDYRWTTGRTLVALPNLSDRYQVLRLRAHGWRPNEQPAPQVQLDLAGRPWAAIQTTPEIRRYSLLLPRRPAGPLLDLSFTSPVYTAPDSPREIGFALDWVELRAIEPSGVPSPWHLGGQALLLALVLLLIWALALSPAWTAAPAALLVSLMAWANLRQPLWISQAIVHWLLLAGALLLATWLLAPRLRQALEPWMAPGQARAAWALFVAALALRLAGAAHPLFDTHDLSVHTRFLGYVDGGQLFLYVNSSEARGQTFYPPAGYLLLLPLQLLLPTPRLVAQVGVALLDALGCLLLLPLARELRLPPLAGLLALALALALPISMTMLWWGFATNALAQSLWLLLLWALLRATRRPSRSAVAVFAALCGIGLLTHVGALLLMLAALGLILGLGWRHLPPARRGALLGGLLAALLFTALFYVSAAIAPALDRRSGDGSLQPGALLAESWADLGNKLGRVAVGMERGFLPLPLALAPLGLVRLLAPRGRRPLGRVVVLAWLAAGLLFFGVWLGVGLLVRYVYFAAPLLCLALGALLAPLWRRPGGRVVVLALVLLVAWSGAALWVAGVLMRVKPSALPLTH